MKPDNLATCLASEQRPLRQFHAPRINVALPQNSSGSKESLPILKGTVPVTIFIADEDRIALENSRYEIMLFVDTVFLFEDEAGFSPFT